MSAMFSAQNSWLRYFTELSTRSLITLDARPPESNADGAGRSTAGEQELDFDTALQDTLAEYGATRDRLELLEKKLEKMLEIKEAKVRSDYEVARRNLELLEREGSVIRQIMSSPTRIGDEDDITIKAERAGISSFQYTGTKELLGKEARSPTPDHRAHEELEETKLRLAREEHARQEAERARDTADRLREEAEREREDAIRARADAERALSAVEARVKAAEGRARAVRAQVNAAGTGAGVNALEGMPGAPPGALKMGGGGGGGESIMNIPNESVDGFAERYSPDPFGRSPGLGRMANGSAEGPPVVAAATTMEDVHRRNPWIAAGARSVDDIRAQQNSSPFVKPIEATIGGGPDAKSNGSGNGTRKRKLSKRNKPPTIDGGPAIN